MGWVGSPAPRPTSWVSQLLLWKNESNNIIYPMLPLLRFSASQSVDRRWRRKETKVLLPFGHLAGRLPHWWDLVRKTRPALFSLTIWAYHASWGRGGRKLWNLTPSHARNIILRHVQSCLQITFWIWRSSWQDEKWKTEPESESINSGTGAIDIIWTTS